MDGSAGTFGFPECAISAFPCRPTRRFRQPGREMPQAQVGEPLMQADGTGAIRVLAWKAFRFSRNPAGVTNTIMYSSHCRTVPANPAGKVTGMVLSKNALTPKPVPRASATAGGRR